MKDEDIVITEEHPKLALQHVVRVIARHDLKPAPPKASISLRIDQDVLEWFRAQGPGYQTRINMVLRAFRDATEQGGGSAVLPSIAGRAS